MKEHTTEREETNELTLDGNTRLNISLRNPVYVKVKSEKGEPMTERRG